MGRAFAGRVAFCSAAKHVCQAKQRLFATVDVIMDGYGGVLRKAAAW